MNGAPDLSELSIHELIRLHRTSLAELRSRGVVRTRNPPQGDWAEFLVATAYSGELAPNSEKSWDVLAAGDRRLQVKARVLDPDRVGSNVTGVFRSWDFDAAVIVLFNDNLEVTAASELHVDDVKDMCRFSKHVRGSAMRPTPANLARGIDVTTKLQVAASRA